MPLIGRNSRNSLGAITRKGILRAFLMLAVVYTLLIVILLRVVFPLLFPENEGFDYMQGYTFTAITLISLIPFLNGSMLIIMMPAGLPKDGAENNNAGGADSENGVRSVVVLSVVLTLVMTLTSMYLTDPVSTEGWLRSLFVALLMAAMAPLIPVLTALMIRGRFSGIVSAIFMLLLTLTLPAGLLLNRPWSYLAFPSPFYWTGWAWVVTDQKESLLYGFISVSLSFIIFFPGYRKLSAVKPGNAV